MAHMPSASTAPSLAALSPHHLHAVPGAAQLAQASRALWLATLGLMTAFMQMPAPAHRYLLARRIARNFDTLAGQECFDSGCRASFGRLAKRWRTRSEEFAPEKAAAEAPSTGWRRFLP
jgi:hypothetical protein